MYHGREERPRNFGPPGRQNGMAPAPFSPAKGPPRDDRNFRGDRRPRSQDRDMAFRGERVRDEHGANGVPYNGPPRRVEPRDNRGPPPRDNRGPPPRDNRGPPPRENKGPPPRNNRGPPPRDDRGPPPRDDRGPPPRDDRGPPPRNDRGPPPRNDRGPPPRNDRGPPPRDGRREPPRGPAFSPPRKDGRGADRGLPPPEDWNGRDRREPDRGPRMPDRGPPPRGRSPPVVQPPARETRNPRLRDERTFEDRPPPRVHNDERARSGRDRSPIHREGSLPRRGPRDEPPPRRGPREEPLPRRGPREEPLPKRGPREGPSPRRGPRDERNGRDVVPEPRNANYRHEAAPPGRRRSPSPFAQKAPLRGPVRRDGPFDGVGGERPQRGRSPPRFEGNMRGPPPDRKRASSVEENSRMLPPSIVRQALIMRNQSPLKRAPPVHEEYPERPREMARRGEHAHAPYGGAPENSGSFDRRAAPIHEPDFGSRGRPKPMDFSPPRARGRPIERGGNPPALLGPPRHEERAMMPMHRPLGFSAPHPREPLLDRMYASPRDRAVDDQIHNFLQLSEERRMEALAMEGYPMRGRLPIQDRREVEIIRERSPLDMGRGRRALLPIPSEVVRPRPAGGRPPPNMGGRDRYGGQADWVRDIREIPPMMPPLYAPRPF